MALSTSNAKTLEDGTPDYKVADINLADFGRKEIELAEHEMPGLMACREDFGSKKHREVAREAVRKSLVVLKNENNLLPLSKNIKNLHVAGLGANDIGMLCGGWTMEWQGKLGNITSLENKEILNDNKFSLGGSWLRGFDVYGAGPRYSYTSGFY